MDGLSGSFGAPHAPFDGGGQVGLDDGEVGEPAEGAPASSGGALLDLDRAQGALCFVVGEDVQVRAGGEAQDHVLVAQEPAGEAAGVPGDGTVPEPAAPEPFGGGLPVAGGQLVQDGGVQRGLAGGAGGGRGVAGP